MSELTPESFFEFNFLSEPKLSPDEEIVAFLVRGVNDDGEDYDTNIWVYDLEKELTKQLTTSNQDGSYVWVGERELLFTSERGDSNDQSEGDRTDFYRINVTGGEAKKAFSVPHAVSSFKADEDELVYKAMVEVEDEDDEDAADCVTLDEIPFWANGKGFTNKKRNHLFSRELMGEGEVTELTPGSIDVDEYVIGPEEIVFVGMEYEDRAPITSELYLIARDNYSSGPERLTDRGGRFWLVEFVEERRLFLTYTDMEENGLNENQALYEYDLRGGGLTKLGKDWKDSFSNRILTDVRLGSGQNSKTVEDGFYFLSTKEGVSYLARADESGKLSRLTEESGSVDDFDVGSRGEVFVKLSSETPQELYRLSEDGREEQLTELNEGSVPKGTLSTPESFTVERNGKGINSWVLTPPDFDPDSSYPGILEVHGGPKAAYGDVYFHELQLLANSGYVVLFSNPRGSDGRGDEFADIRGEYGQNDYRDLMAVIDRALEQYPFIDGDRLGVTGGSYGGFMTNWIIGHTDRFDAAVSCRSISNWVSKFNTTDIGYFFVRDQQDGNPWEDHEALWDQSPLKYADQVTTPTLFIHSREDYRCWEGEAMQMFTALKYFDVPARLCLFEGENHELSRGGKPVNRVKRLEEMVGWFDEYLK
ncbi:S9 family peptidase [Candidatus Bipolaricaulota bacterium]|nr:S9 family peptidase [Candidatus Bipolaricaulota bacterium]